MSTRSRIGIIRGEDSSGKKIVESIYCHFDGYPEGVGQTLLDHWTNEAKINELLSLGDLSALGDVIGEKHDFDWHTEGEASQKGWCLFYGRDRNESGVSSITHPFDEWPDYGQECEYVFDPGTQVWRVSSEARGNPMGWNTVAEWPGFITIPEAIKAENAS
jgi:hypothetical protein